MRFDDFVELLGAEPSFDLATVTQLIAEPRASVVSQLHRWGRAGKVIALRRGRYTLADRYRRAPLAPATLANVLLTPSYLSGAWALSFYGVIPESVPVYTSVTTRTPREFENRFGAFSYRNVKRDFFFGYHAVPVAGSDAAVATMEKALLDLFHLTPGAWDADRMIEMRFQQTELLDLDRLDAFARRMAKPRILRAVRVWRECCYLSDDEGEEL